MSDNTNRLLQQDIAFSKLLANRNTFIAKGGGSIKTSGGMFTRRMHSLDWTPGKMTGTDAWDAYYLPIGLEMVFSRASGASIAHAIQHQQPNWNWHDDVGSIPLRLPLNVCVSAVVLELKDWSWNLVFPLVHRKPYEGEPLNDWSNTIATCISQLTGDETIGVSNFCVAHFLSGEKKPLVHMDDWYHEYFDDWLDRMGIFVPPYNWSLGKRANEVEGYFFLWLAGIPIEQVTRVDLFEAPLTSVSMP